MKDKGTPFPRLRFQAHILAACLAATLLTPMLVVRAEAKDYYFPKVRVTVRIERDGSFRLVEERTFKFTGGFHWAEYRLPKSGYSGLTGFSIADEQGPYRQVDADAGEPGTFVLNETPEAYLALFYYSAADTEKTFTISYRIHGAVRVHADAADFYWKLVGSGWEKRTSSFEGYVELPQEVDPERLYVFGHGPLQGQVERDGGRGAVYRLRGLPARTFLEARVVFPPEILDVLRSGGPALERLLEEERGLAAKADRERRQNRLLARALVAVPFLMFVLWVYLFFKYGREYRPDQEVVYTRDIPSDLPPALVGYLMRFKRLTAGDFTATIMNLVRQGYISLESKEEEKGLIFKKEVPVILFTRTKKNPGGLLPHEKVVYDFLFAPVTYESVLDALPGKAGELLRKVIGTKTGALPGMAGQAADTVSSEDIKKYIRKHPHEFRVIYETFSRLVKEEGKAKGFFDPKAELVMILFGVAAVLVPVAGIVVAAVKRIVFIIPVYAAAVLVFVFLIAPLARRTKPGAEQYARWKGLKRFLRDFSDMKTAPPASIAVWEAYLVYAVTFGISKKVLKQMKLVLPQYSQEEVMKSNFFAASMARGGDFNADVIGSFAGFVDSMVSSFNSISSAASSTGGGGGFSGGGGGGGGGSGGGAG